jgi:hypothetical protein
MSPSETPAPSGITWEMARVARVAHSVAAARPTSIDAASDLVASTGEEEGAG